MRPARPVSFASSCAAAALSVAVLAIGASPSQADDGADAFRAACQHCHANPARLARRNSGATAASRAARWDTMLRSHHAEDPIRRAQIIDFLERSR